MRLPRLCWSHAIAGYLRGPRRGLGKREPWAERIATEAGRAGAVGLEFRGEKPEDTV